MIKGHGDECLNTNWFMSLKHARDIIEDWRKDYNEVRPHSSLKGTTPKEYAETVGWALASGATNSGVRSSDQGTNQASG